MKKIIYPAKYTDKLGIVETEIINDGEELSIKLRGVEFKDTDFDNRTGKYERIYGEIKK